MYVAIETEQLAKRHAGGHESLRDLTLHAEEGEIVAFVAGAGEGKTSLVRILTGRLLPTSGRARVAGVDVVQWPKEARARTGVTAREAASDGMLTGRQYLGLVGALGRLSLPAAQARADQLLGLLGLTELSELRLSVHPAVMRRRLELAASLVVAPEVLVLDEPAAGLGPASRRALWAEIHRARAEGSTVLLATADIEGARSVADRLVTAGRQSEVMGAGAGGEKRTEAA